MPRAVSPIRHRVVAALGVIVGLVACAAPADGQTTLFDSGGFEGFNLGPIFTAPNFKTLPANAAGIVQDGTKLNGARAFQVVGPTMVAPGYDGSGANFWYRSDAGVQHTATVATPYVQVHFAAMRTTVGGLIPVDIPAAGVYMESPSSLPTFGNSVGNIMFTSDGRIAVSTGFSSTAGGSDGLVTTAVMGQFAVNVWHEVFAELNFNTQSFSVYLKGNPNPLQFQADNGAMLTEVPFRNTFGPSTGIQEIGMIAFNYQSGGESSPQNNFFIDDFKVTYSSTSQVPVPEPGLMLAVGAVGLAGLRAYRRRRAAAAA
jgi:hypothetical protein